MRKGKGSLKHRLTKASKEALDEEIKKAMDESGLTKQAEALRKKEKQIKNQIAEKERSDTERRELEERLAEEKKKQDELEAQKKRLEQERKEAQIHCAQSMSGGYALETIRLTSNNNGSCYPSSAIIYDANGRPRRIESLKIGDEVQVITSTGLRSEPVITFIHRQPEIVDKFVKITTMKKKILKISEDHLLFVEEMGQATAIPARDVKVGDTVYVKGSHGPERDSVQSISTVYEKGAYAPVTLSGTILVNDVHTSCYFDVLSHEWSHRAMGVARAVYYVSPGML